MDALPVTEETDLPFASKVRTHLSGAGGRRDARVRPRHPHGGAARRRQRADRDAGRPARHGEVHLPAGRGGRAAGREPAARRSCSRRACCRTRGRWRSSVSMPFRRWRSATSATRKARRCRPPTRWEVKIVGKQSHGARPELSIDPIVTAAQFVQALQTIRSRTMSGHEPGVVTIGTIHGGQRHNIIPAEVTLTGTIRTLPAGDEPARRGAAARDPEGRRPTPTARAGRSCATSAARRPPSTTLALTRDTSRRSNAPSARRA